MKTNTAPNPSPTRQPVLFIGHGNPMHAIDDNPFKLEWQAWGQRLRAHYPTPRAIVCVSAHWITSGWQITTAAQPRTIHDFGGFPPELFAQRYPAPGAPALAAEIMQSLSPQLAIQSDGEQWGLDHGAWAVLMHLFPAADFPVLQLSLNANASLEEHYTAGQVLSALRDAGIMLIGSGNVVHNFGLMHAAPGGSLWQQAFAFDALVAQALDAQQHQALYQFNPPNAALLHSAHPTLEHYLPLLYSAGAARADDAVSQTLTGNYAQAPVGMRCVQWG